MTDELRFQTDPESADDSWAAFAAATSGRGPLEYFHSAMDFVDGNNGRGRQAIDLGCRGGADTRALLSRGWRVFAMDAEPGARRLLTAGLPPDSLHRLDIAIGAFHEVELPGADLVYAQFSLPFAGEYFERAVVNALKAVVPGGAFVGQLLGINDGWITEEGAAAVDQRWIEQSFADFASVEIDEREHDAPYGPERETRHFHFFHIQARR
ncbi:hypothetical protein BMS3Bbin02_01966 [bacterium BMS3Bbin02]|nr:hypothetical protein BMS3Bbin02_01966 [bacterium BMS3Bbin02]